LPITLEDVTLSGALGAILTTARIYELTAYDAAYLELAARHGVALATQDERLQAAAAQAGIPLVWAEAIGEKAAAVRHGHRPRLGLGASGGHSAGAAALIADSVADEPR
jgi:hypothetical protein